MRCHRARTAIVESGLGLLSSAERRVLEEHLARCPRCARSQRLEDRFTRELAALGGLDPAPLDVTARVMQELRRAEPTTRWAGWQWLGAAAASLVVAAALGGLALTLTLPQRAAELRPWMEGVGAAVPGASSPLLALASAIRALGRVGVELIELTSQLLLHAQPLLQGVVLAALTGLLGIAVAVLGRDLRLMPMRKEP